MMKAKPVTVRIKVDAIDAGGKMAVLSARLIDDDGTELASITTQRVAQGEGMDLENVFAVPRTTGVGDTSMELVFELPEKKSKKPHGEEEDTTTKHGKHK